MRKTEEPAAGSMLTRTSLQPIIMQLDGSAGSLNESRSSSHRSADFGNKILGAGAGAQQEQLVELESLICRQHVDLRLHMEELLVKQTKLLDTRMENQVEQMKVLTTHVEDHAEQTKLLNAYLQGHSKHLMDALRQVSFASHTGNLEDESGIATCNGLDKKPKLAPSRGDPDTEMIMYDDADERDDSTEDLVNEFGLSGVLNSCETANKSSDSSMERGHLATDRTNLHFAGDLLRAFSNDGVNELHTAMQKCELPILTSKGGFFHMEPERTSLLAKVLSSGYFEYFVCLVILANTCFITYSTDYAVNHPFNQQTDTILALETIFQIYYIVELILKLTVHRMYFFINKDFLWNDLDFVLVIAASYDLVLTHGKFNEEDISSGASNGFSLMFLRLLRLARLMKVMRLFRVVRFFSELNVLLKVVTQSLRPLFWCTFMLVVFIYMFAVIFVHGTASYIAWDGSQERTREQLRQSFGSVRISMLSLSKASTGGEDWGAVGETLMEAGSTYYGLYLFFIGFCYLALMNILTGLFVDRTFKAVADDHDGLALEKLYSDRSVVADLCRLYCAMSGEDIDSPSTITEQTFAECMSSPVMRARLSVLDLEVWDSGQFFEMLTSISRTKELDLQSWVTGCMQLRGFARRISVQAMHADVQKLKKWVGTTKSHAMPFRGKSTTTTLGGTFN